MSNPFIRVKSLREHKGWTQSDLSRESGVDQANISRLEAGKTPNVSAILLGQLADALGTTLDYLTGKTDNPHPRANPATISFIERAAADPRVQYLVRIFVDELDTETQDLAYRIITELASAIGRRRGP